MDNEQRDELKQRVEAKRKRVEARVHELRADATEESRRKADELEAQLDSVKQSLRDGYENLESAAVEKINSFLKD